MSGCPVLQLEPTKHLPNLLPTASSQPSIFNYNAQNPDFVPGYSVLRVERAKYLLNAADKTTLMNSIVDDLVATVTSINTYHRTGLLSDENIAQVSMMLHTIGSNNVKIQARLDNKIARLKSERSQLRDDYRELACQMDVMGQRYAARVLSLEEQVQMLKGQLAWVEVGGRLRERQLQSRADECVDHDRHCVSEGPLDQMVQDDPDGEYEEEF